MTPNTKFYTHEDVLDTTLGEKGTELREQYESEMKSFLMGEAIKRARQSKQLTQEQLGNRMGVKRAQVSRIEKGQNLTFSTISRAFKALEIPAYLDMGALGRVALW